MANLVRRMMTSDRNAARRSVMPAVITFGWSVFILCQGLTAETWLRAVTCIALFLVGSYVAFVYFRWNRQARDERPEQYAGLELIRGTRSQD